MMKKIICLLMFGAGLLLTIHAQETVPTSQVPKTKAELKAEKAREKERKKAEKAKEKAEREAAKAKAKEQKAQMKLLRKSYENGEYAQCVPLASQLVSEEYPDAFIYQARLYHYGRGVEKNETQAETWYLKGRASGDKDCVLGLGELYMDYGREAEAVELLQPLAERTPQAAYLLGQLYGRGNYDKELGKKLAIKYYLMSVENSAYEQRSKIELKKLGRPVRYTKREMNSAYVSVSGKTPAEIFQAGQKAYNYPHAFAYMKEAASKGFAPAMEWLSEAYARKEDLIYSKSKAEQWLDKAYKTFMSQAQKGETDLYADVARFHREGIGRAVDLKEARQYLMLGAQKGSVQCQLLLGHELKDEGSAQDALRWFVTAAEHGSPEGALLAAQLYETGAESANESQRVRKDRERATEMYRKARFLEEMAKKPKEGSEPTNRGGTHRGSGQETNKQTHGTGRSR